MEEFTLPIDVNKFRSTNGIWNDLKLNDPWSVGYVTSLIVIEEFANKEDWESFYYKSGEQRDQQIQGLNNEQQTLINDEQLVSKNSLSVKQLPWNLKNLNFQFGRTEKQLRKKGQLLNEAVKDNGYALTVEDCFQCVRFRVICETWNAPYINKARFANQQKNQQYKTEFGVPVYDIIAGSSGNILNQEIIKNL